jgi:DUF4097 and DUF4098 domain-containing protein YvlB
MVAAGAAKVEVYVHANSSDQFLSKEDIQKKLDEYYSINISLDGDILSATARKKKEFLNGQNSLNISFVIYVAKNTSTRIRTDHGNLELSGLEGGQDIRTSHGNIDIEKITGKLTAQTSHGNVSIRESKDDIDISTDHGNIEAKNCDGIVKLVTSNGNIQLDKQKGKISADTDHGDVSGNGIEGELSASTSHGDVDLENLSCSIVTSTQHGNIDLSIKTLTGDINANNSSGNITLKLPQGKGIDLDLKGKSLSVDRTENFNGTKEKNSMKGTLNGGGTKVKAKSDRGTVSLTLN